MKKPFTTVAVVVFLLGWEVVVNGVHIPLWASLAAFVFAAGLAAMVWRESHP